MEHAIPRRNLIHTTPNPYPEQDYIISLQVEWPDSHGGMLQLHVRYVPDQLITNNDSFYTYANHLLKEVGLPLEGFGAAMVEDINNALIPRWVHIFIHHETPQGRHQTNFEDSQPRWHNPKLLARLTPF